MYSVDSLLVYTLIFIGCALVATIILIMCLVALGYTMRWVFFMIGLLPDPDPPTPPLNPIQKMFVQASKLDQRWYLRTEGGRLLSARQGEITEVTGE